jgi:hypothetical protein
MGETMSLNDLIEAAATAWGWPLGLVQFEITQKRVTIRARGELAPLFEDVAPSHPAVGLVAEEVLRAAIATKLLERAAKDATQAQKSREDAERFETWARNTRALAEKVDPRCEARAQAVVRVDGEVIGHAAPAAPGGAA